jgi:hypothetical protein
MHKEQVDKKFREFKEMQKQKALAYKQKMFEKALKG